MGHPYYQGILHYLKFFDSQPCFWIHFAPRGRPPVRVPERAQVRGLIPERVQVLIPARVRGQVPLQALGPVLIRALGPVLRVAPKPRLRALRATKKGEEGVWGDGSTCGSTLRGYCSSS